MSLRKAFKTVGSDILSSTWTMLNSDEETNFTCIKKRYFLGKWHHDEKCFILKSFHWTQLRLRSKCGGTACWNLLNSLSNI